MRMPRLLFLVFFVVDSILLHGAALDPNHDSISNLTALSDTEPSKPHLLPVHISKLDKHIGEERGAVLGSVLQNVKQVIMKSLGAARLPCCSGFAQVRPPKVASGHWSEVRSSHHSGLHQEQSSEVTEGHLPSESDQLRVDLMIPPEEALAMVKSQDDETVLWLQHAARINWKNGDKTSSTDEMEQLLSRIPSLTNEVRYANLFAEMGSNGLGDLAESMQRRRFHDLIVKYGMTPSDLERNLHPHGRLPTSLPETDPLYGAYKAFALEFAAVRSPSTQKKLEQYFLAGDRISADKYLAKLENSATGRLYPYHKLTDDQRKVGH